MLEIQRNLDASYLPGASKDVENVRPGDPEIDETTRDVIDDVLELNERDVLVLAQLEVCPLLLDCRLLPVYHLLHLLLFLNKSDDFTIPKRRFGSEDTRSVG